MITLILDSSLLWQTVSNAAEKSTATQTVRSGGFLWLNPIAMHVVNCNRAEVVECSCLKPCWSGAGRRYLLMVGRIRVSRTFALGPSFFKWKILSLSVSNALLFLQLLIALVTMSAVNVSAISIGFFLVSLVTTRVSLGRRMSA